MKPRPIVQIQAGLAFVASLVVIGLTADAGAIGTLVASGLGALLAGGLAPRYHRLVRGRTRSRHRAARDRTMLVCIAAGLLAPMIVSVAQLTLDLVRWSPPLHDVPGHVAAIAGGAVFAAMLASSCVDWYLIRPFRDGVVNPPVCQMEQHDDETALFYARAWIAHRAMADLVGWSGVAIVAIIALVAIQGSTEDPTWTGILTYLAPSGAVYLGVGGHLAKRLRPVPSYLQQESPGLGRWARGRIHDEFPNPWEIDGFVVDVAMGVGLQILDDSDGDGDRNRSFVPLGAASKLSATTRVLCRDRCEHWIPQCERGLLEKEAPPPPPPSGELSASPAADEPSATAS